MTGQLPDNLNEAYDGDITEVDLFFQAINDN